MPLAGLTVATEVAALLHVPPVTVSESVATVAAHNNGGTPDIVPDVIIGLTVIGKVAVADPHVVVTV
jgi:hypothetical protein